MALNETYWVSALSKQVIRFNYMDYFAVYDKTVNIFYSTQACDTQNIKWQSR